MSLKVFDFFSGCGGASLGFRNAGMDIVLALDNDPDAKKTFEANKERYFPSAEFFCEDITTVKVEIIKSLINSCGNSPILFCGCAPCQPFTKQNTEKRENDNRIPLLDYFKHFVDVYRPTFIFVENVPGMRKGRDGLNPFESFEKFLYISKYSVTSGIVRALDYGVPQRRRRLVLLASRLGEIEMPSKTYGVGTSHENFSIVREKIGNLPRIEAGETHPDIINYPNHQAAKLSDKNLQRIKATPIGGDRRDWIPDLYLDCHTKRDYSGHTDVYGRMKWDEPASGLTTRCISLSNGRFGHPEQNRAISVREAACLQTFPMDFIFKGNLNSMARQIGNAVPVLLAEVFGEHFIRHWIEYQEKMHGKIQNKSKSS